jgi:hypothetical protein
MKIRISALAILLVTFFAANVPSAANKQSQPTLLPGIIPFRQKIGRLNNFSIKD